MITEEKLTELLVKLIGNAETKLPESIKQALQEAYQKETTPLGRVHLAEILKNTEIAEKENIPLCQDTGILNFYVSCPEDKAIPIRSITKAIHTATRIATKKIPLRPNAVDPLTRENSKDNTGNSIPPIEIEFADDDSELLEITVFPKGAGSENMTRLAMLNPSEGTEGIERFTIETVKNAGGKPCPPGLIGVGIGGSSDIALKLAKKALLKDPGSENNCPELNELQNRLKTKINELNIGPMGLGGDTTCLSVRVDKAHTHTGSLPVAVNIGCWATRKATLQIKGEKINFV